MDKTRLWSRKKDHAVYLPSIQSPWISAIRKSIAELRPEGPVPGLLISTKPLNFMGHISEAAFWWPRSLCSPGSSGFPKPFQRTNNSSILADSGGYQIAAGRWNEDWLDPAQSDGKRRKILDWQERMGDELVVLDVPSRTVHNDYTPYTTFSQTLDASVYNARWWAEQASKPLLNTLHGDTMEDMANWYRGVNIEDEKFIGWCVPALGVPWTIPLQKTRFLLDMTGGDIERLHYLGRGTKEAALSYTAVKRAMMKRARKYLDVTYDNSAPFIAAGKNRLTIKEFDDGSYSLASQDSFYMAWDGPFQKFQIEGRQLKKAGDKMDALGVAIMAAHGTYQKIKQHQDYVDACTEAYGEHPKRTGIADVLEEFVSRLRDGKVDQDAARDVRQTLSVVDHPGWSGAEMIDLIEEYLFTERPNDFLRRHKDAFDQWIPRTKITIPDEDLFFIEGVEEENAAAL